MVYGNGASSGIVRFTVLVGRVSNWCARLLGTLLVILIAVFLVGEGLPPVGRIPVSVGLMFLAQVISLGGFVALWRWKLPGGLVSLAGIMAFYAVNYAASGRFPGGWVFPLFFLPGLLAIVSWVVERVSFGGGQCAMDKGSN